MSWLTIDDRALEHPKFIRAFKMGGSEAVHFWLGLLAYCAQNLTDGFIPDDMLDEVRGPTSPKKRQASLQALKTVGLVDDAEGGIQLHDYLAWSASRAEVLERRKKAAERKAKSRDPSRRDTPRDSARTPRAVTAVVTDSDPIPSQPLQSEEEDPSSSVFESSTPEPIPDGLFDAASAAGMFTELVAHMPGIVVEQLEQKGRSFVRYWTVGSGKGQRRRRWLSKFRDELLRAYDLGKLPRPGTGETEQRGAEDAERRRLFERAEIGGFGDSAKAKARQLIATGADREKFIDALERLAAKQRGAPEAPARSIAKALGNVVQISHASRTANGGT